MSLAIARETLASHISDYAVIYDRDYCLWIETMMQLLREGKFSEIDIPNLLEELDDMSGSQRDALESNLEIILMHLLKLNSSMLPKAVLRGSLQDLRI